MHGKTSQVHHEGRPLLSRRADRVRGDSVITLWSGDPATIPACLLVTATTIDGVIMAVRHREFPIYGIQFHPESIGTTGGKQLLRNFLLDDHLRHA